jgi:hypothetical protein
MTAASGIAIRTAATTATKATVGAAVGTTGRFAGGGSFFAGCRGSRLFVFLLFGFGI